MARRCKYSQCKAELPAARQCADYMQKRGFCNVECATQCGLELAEEKRLKDIRKVMNPNPPKPKRKSQTELTQQVFNRMIRLLDDGKPCISCGRSQCGTFWDAGHYRSVGSCPEIRFDARNCHIQGSGCNRANRRPDKNNAKGAETIAQEYEARLRDRYGDSMVDWLNGPHEMPRWRDDDLRALRRVFAAECRRLEKGERPSRDWRALDYEIKELID